HGTVLHGKPDAIQHEPSGFLSDAKRAGNLAGANTILRAGNNPDGGKPLIQAKRRVFEYSPNLRGELTPSMTALALPFLLGGEIGHIGTAASGANDTRRPAMRDHVPKAVIGIREVNDGFL
ncbi:MAG TPA: hypothetical protein VMV98_07935, partial [Acidobacteriaceae bacterium]|nr:hypothetical protein [Acidobacteriaceae bacterium]